MKKKKGEKRNECWSGFSLRIGVAGEYCKVTGGLLWIKGKVLSGNKQNLAREFSDLRCLMNTLLVCLLARPHAVCSSKVIVVMLNIKVHAFLLIHY